MARLLRDLSGSTKEKDVRDLAALDAKDKARLQILRTDLGRSRATAAGRIEGLKNRLSAFNTAFVNRPGFGGG